jgi:hypothetical protein
VSSLDRPASVADWFYIVDLEARSRDDPNVLRDGSVVLGLSATEADADAVATLDGLGVVYYTQLSESDRRALRKQVERRGRNGP